ncbi:MAG: HesA/MoeB/ThiF family protein [Proteobacteria bacterium]|nr:HesA/MoeB/ThiF family protein [Pseudomonadota bacterium]MBU2227822.1 HesA/MoeB/ThiF family protein [Pseudomonadota bacterium]MBU2262604.1 HesA/MoeB/ThiF family protein [Pseudomonadota bacterium]
MASEWHHLIHERSRKIVDPAGREVQVIEDRAVLEITAQCGLSFPEIYTEALRLGVYPCRYLRNRDLLSAAEQLRLAEAQVAVAGAGGLGGQVIILLARLGVGRLIVADQDRFDETNLNRQALSNEQTLKRFKTEVAAESVASINPGVKVIPRQVKLEAPGIDEILAGAEVVVDALDNVPDRLILEAACQRLGIPMVHGAIAGFEGRMITICPGDPGLKQLYGTAEPQDKKESPEAILGTPAVTAAWMGTFQAMEVLKILLKRGRLFRGTMAYFDLENGRFEEFFLNREQMTKTGKSIN